MKQMKMFNTHTHTHTHYEHANPLLNRNKIKCIYSCVISAGLDHHSRDNAVKSPGENKIILRGSVRTQQTLKSAHSLKCTYFD